MDVKYINPFINACIEVFSTFTQLESRPGKPLARIAPSRKGDIRAVIGLTGHGIDGYFIIHFTREFLHQILTTLFGFEDHPTDEELCDLAGELTNMVTGCAKAALSERGFFFNVAVPQITLENLDIPSSMRKSPVIQVPFQTAMGNYFMEASILTRRDGAQPAPARRRAMASQ